MQTLMRDILDYASPAVRETQPVSMAAVVRSSASECQALTGKLRVQVTVEAAEDGKVVVNPVTIVRALENLLENAIQHSRPGGTVTVRLARGGPDGRKMLRCDVIDQGPGFPPEHMGRLFTPFFTLRPGGTGLGLTIAKRIIEDLGGMIRLSNGVTGGARVSVWLPLRADIEEEFQNSLSEYNLGAK